VSKYIISSLIFLGMLFSPVLIHAFQSEDVYPISKDEHGYTGAGVEWMLTRAADSQFVLLGEQHGVKQLGDFIGYTLEELHDDGFNHFGLEMDAWTIEQVQQNGVDDFISSYPNSVAFGFDGELTLIQEALNLNIELGGMDQMITAVHPFQRLAELSNTASQRRLSQGAFLKASLKMGEYLRQEHFEDLERLESEFSSHESTEVHQILDELKMSMEIYTIWRAGQRGEVSKQKSPEMRESMMKVKFDKWLLNNKSQQIKKAVFKMGGAHLMYGIGPNGIPTLGEHIRKQATKHGFNTFSIGIRNFDPETAMVTAEDFGNAEILVIDTKTVRNRIENDGIEIPHFEENKLSIYGFDAIVYFKNAEWSNQSILSTYKQEFRNAFFTRIIPLAILLIFCLTSIFPNAYQLVKRKEIEDRVPLLISLTSVFLIVSLVIFQILNIRSIIPDTATIMSANVSIWLFLILFTLSGIHLYLSASTFLRKRFSSGFRIYYAVIAVSFTLLSVYCYYWNVGGMLSNMI